MDSYIERRLLRLRKSIAAKGLDAALIFGPENRFYFSGFFAEDLGCNESSGALLITRDENFLLTDGRYKEQAEKEAKGFLIKIYKKGLVNLLKGLLKELSVRYCGYEPGYISVSAFNKLKKGLVFVYFKELGGFPERLRTQKDKHEINIIKKSQEICEKVFEQALKEIKPGISEKEIAFTILKGLYERAQGPSFPPIVASGPNSSLPHAVPTDRKIGESEPIIIDMGARYKGYCSDMTRTLIVGKAPKRVKEIYAIVKKAQSIAQKKIRAGMSARQADAVARSVIEEAGYGEYFCHGLGHGVGIAIHEAPALSFRNRKKLVSDSIITVEPGIYLPGKFGVRLENMGVVTEKGLEIITSNKWYYDF